MRAGIGINVITAIPRTIKKIIQVEQRPAKRKQPVKPVVQNTVN